MIILYAVALVYPLKRSDTSATARILCSVQLVGAERPQLVYLLL